MLRRSSRQKEYFYLICNSLSMSSYTAMYSPTSKVQDGGVYARVGKCPERRTGYEFIFQTTVKWYTDDYDDVLQPFLQIF